MQTRFDIPFGLVLLTVANLLAAPMDVAPFGLPLPEGNGVMWEDPREIHQVAVRFKGPAPRPETLRLEYWGSWWPGRHLPKDREPGGGDIGWLELGNWYRYGWRTADTEAQAAENTITFSFRPVNAKEFPNVKDYPAKFRYTLKLRVTSTDPLPPMEQIFAYTDSVWADGAARVVWQKEPKAKPQFEAFNGRVEKVLKATAQSYQARLLVASNPDPNTFDRTLVTVRQGKDVFTFKYDELAKNAIFIPTYGAAVLPAGDERTYAQVAVEQKARNSKTLYERVAEMPEQTWRAAWDGMPPKKSRIYLPLGMDGGRQRFRLDADGGILFRSNDNYLKKRPGKDTPRLDLEGGPVRFRFGLTAQPVDRTIEEASLPICRTTWEVNDVRIQQVALVTRLEGVKASEATPPGDAFAVFLARFTFSNPSDTPKSAALPVQYGVGNNQKIPLKLDNDGLLWSGERCRGQVIADGSPDMQGGALKWTWEIPARSTRTLIIKVPYVVLTEKSEHAALKQLTFDRELVELTGFWRRRLDESARLITPEPMLNEFYRAHAGHLLINCEREPASDRRFARVGSFGYGAYGNESCMMVVDLERRGYHKEAQDCLDAWLHYQGTVALPGSFASQEGVLYGAGGYEAGGYNQHHGWILWCLAEHYKFTRDEAWLQKAVPGILKGAQWIISETKRTATRHELERGLLPAGSLEDIGDWWTWLSTSCYTWRGLDAAAWALEQARHPEAKNVRREATAYHKALLNNFRTASQRSPVVRLRDGTAVPQIPSQVHRRGRSFGWICQTLEGAIHLLITGALDPHSPEAEWIVKDYEDNLYLSNQYGYTVDDFDKHWFARGGMSMQACLLLDVEPYLYRDDVKHALRALFNAQAVSYFPDVRLNTEHALPEMGDWRGDHYKSSDESNCAGWLRYLFVREQGDELLLGQAIPREWLKAGQTCGLERAGTYFGPVSVVYAAELDRITVRLNGPMRNPPKTMRLRLRELNARPISSVTIDDKKWTAFKGDWVILPGNIGMAKILVNY